MSFQCHCAFDPLLKWSKPQQKDFGLSRYLTKNEIYVAGDAQYLTCTLSADFCENLPIAQAGHFSAEDSLKRPNIF